MIRKKMRLNIQIKLTLIIAVLIFGLMLFSTYFISRAVEWRLTSMFRTHLDSTLNSVAREYGRIKDETLASAKSFAQMMSIVRNVLLKERLEIQKEVARLKVGVELDILEVGDAQGLVMVGGVDLEEYGEDKSGEPLIQAALAGEATVTMEIMPTGFFIRAASPIMLREKVIGTFTTGYFLDESFLNKIKKMTGIELFLFEKQDTEEKIIASTLPVDRFLLQSIFDRILQQDYAYVSIADKPYAVGIIAIPHRKEELIGAVRGALPSEQLMATVAEMKRFLILIGFIGVFLATAIGYLFARRITVPIRLLVRGTEEVTRGDYTHFIKVETRDELENLATAFNKMTEHLRKTTVSRDELAQEVIERKSVEEKLRIAYNKLKETQEQLIQAEKLRIVGSLASGVAHEVKNPLAIILTCIDYFSTKIEASDKEASLMFKNMREATMRAKEVIEGVLDFSRPSEMEIKSQSLNSAIDKAVLLMRHQFTKGHIEIIKHFQKDIPHIEMDKDKMVQVFINLFNNAAYAMPDGGKLTIRTYAKRLTGTSKHVGRRREDFFKSGETAIIAEVEDTGTGIPEDKLDKLFDPFFTTRRLKGGTGLGLSIVQSIVNMHRGKIDLENKKEDKGTRVTMTLKV